MGNMTSLPCGWKYAVIDDILPARGIFKDGDWVESKDQDPNGNIRLIQLADIGDGYFVNKSSRFLTKEKALELRCTFLEKGDLLVARMPDPLGRCCIFPFDRRESYVTVVDICVIRLKDDSIDHKYLMYLINSPAIRTVIEEYKTGSTRKRISRGNFAKVDLPIAPLKEQHRIVAKIEELFSEIDKGVESLKTAKAQLQVYRQALLKHAFEGKLTAQWRSNNPDKVVPAEELLRSIEQAREERYQQQLTDWQTAIEKWEFNGKEGKKPSQPRKIKPVFSLATEDCLKLPNLPFTWQWVSFEELLISIRGGTTVPPVDYPTEYSILRSSSVRIGSINYSDVRYLAPDQVKNSLDFVESRDLLFSRLNGSIEFVGNCALVNALHSSKLKLLYPDRLYCAKLLNPTLGKYCELFFASPSVRRSIENKAKSTAGHKRISITDITEMPIPLIGIDEAEQLVNYLEEKITTAIENEKQIDLNIRRTEMLRQSILKKAFSGQLVPQDPNDEPASELLKRIQAEKAERETKTKRKSTK